MKKLVIAAVSVLAFAMMGIAPAYAGSYCNNGTYSANSGSGTCSKNGGVNNNFPSYSDPGSSSYNRQNGFSGNSFSNDFGTSTKKNSNGYGSSFNDNGFGTTTKKNSNGYGSSFNDNGFGSSLSNNGYSNSNGGFSNNRNSGNQSGISNGLGSLSKNCPSFTVC